MRIVHGLLLLVMLLFIAVQFNDPDGLLWAGIYGVPSLMMLVAIMRPQWFSMPTGRVLRWVAVAALAAGIVYFWPKTSGFWRQEVWWETETAREGMGIMIAFLVAASAFLASAATGKKAKVKSRENDATD